jgi:FKBP-type peptidyl-prolyl cis-trans isomerase FkpA
MKKYTLLFTATLIIGLSACLKKQDLPPPYNALAQLAKDTVAIRKFLTLNSINAIKLDSTGIYYQIITPGIGTVTPKSTSVITVKYKGRFLNGNIFDDSKQDSAVFILSNVILGWQLGLPLIKKGGKIRLILPSGYAYEQYGWGTIPPNTNLDFDIELLDVK